MGRQDEIQQATQTLAREATLAELRERAMEKLLLEGVSSAYTSTATETAQGTRVNTAEKGKAIDSFVVNGSIQENLGFLSSGVTGEFTMARGGRTDNWRVQTSVSNWDAFWMNDVRNGTISLHGKENGAERNYLPAVSKVVPGRFDNNNQPWRQAERTDGPNAGPQNEFNPNNHRKELQFILEDGKLGRPLSVNETRERFGNNSVEYRSIVRDMEGNVLGIVSQYMRPTANGYTVDTSARRPANFQK